MSLLLHNGSYILFYHYTLSLTVSTNRISLTAAFYLLVRPTQHGKVSQTCFKKLDILFISLFGAQS